MLLLMATLSLFSSLVYIGFKRVLYEDIDDLLNSRAEGIADSIDTYWEAEKIDAGAKAAPAVLFSKVNNINFAKIAQHWVEERSNDPKLLNIFVQIFDVNGKLIASSKNIAEIHALSAQVDTTTLGNKPHAATLSTISTDNKPFLLRMFTLPVNENGRIAYIVQVANPLSQITQPLNRLRVNLFLILPLTVFCTGMLGAFLARMTLRPIEQMVRTIRQISEENLKLRVQIPETNDEIRRLADTFNDMLAKLDYAFSSQKQFIQDVSHELKTPLTILKGELEVTLKKMRSAEEYQDILSSSLEEINKLSLLIENLLALSRFDSKVMKLDTKRFDLCAVVNAVVRDMEILASQKNIRIALDLSPSVFVETDEKHIRRAILNVLDNAIKYTPSLGTMTVKLGKEGEQAKVSITDTGPGIPEEELPHIFDRFYRVDKSHSSQGFGLGLSITKSIVEAHHGTVEAESQLGKGTTFSIFLPLAPQV
jgi:heavy metal sensor kinase